MASRYRSLEELIIDVSPDRLDDNCEENFLVKLTKLFTGENCRAAARHMGLTISEVDDIVDSCLHINKFNCAYYYACSVYKN